MLRFVVFIACLSSGFAAPAQAQRSMAEGFTRMEIQSAGGKYAHSRVRFGDGTRAERFELRSGDCPLSTGDCQADRERVEFFAHPPGETKGQDWWYTWSIYLPPDWPRTAPVSTVLGQFHQRGRSGPELLFFLDHTGYRIKMTDPRRWDDDPMRPIPDFRNKAIWPRNQMIGRWTKVIVNARWSTDSDGYYRIWVNGDLRDSYSGSTTNDSNEAIYFKYGIYRSFVSKYGAARPPTLVAYYRDVRRARSMDGLK